MRMVFQRDRRRTLSVVALSVMLASPAEGQGQVAAPSRTPLARGVTAFTDVTLLSMARGDSARRNMTVLVRDGRIAAIGRAGTVTVPGGAVRLDGRGKYLLPGLADAHTHLYSDDETPDSLAGYELGVMLANGITTARLMIGTPEQLTLRRDVMSGRTLGPQLWLASPHFTSAPELNARVIANPEDGRAAVREAAAAGYDFIKITNGIGPEAHAAIMAESRAQRIPVDGHVDPRVGIPAALREGQHIQHLDSYIEALLADSAASRASLTQGGVYRLQSWKSMDWLDTTKIARLAGATARAGIWSTPTLTIFNTAFAKGFTDDELRARPDWALMPPRHRALYVRARERYWNPANDSVRTPARRAAYIGIRNALAKAIMDSGGRVLAGSDAPDLLMVYGWTLHRELQSLVEAGLTPYQALQTATRNPAEFFGASREWGTIETGKRADLLLLDADPLTDISNTSRIAGTMIGGRWLPRAILDRMVRDAMARINGH